MRDCSICLMDNSSLTAEVPAYHVHWCLHPAPADSLLYPTTRTLVLADVTTTSPQRKLARADMMQPQGGRKEYCLTSSYPKLIFEAECALHQGALHCRETSGCTRAPSDVSTRLGHKTKLAYTAGEAGRTNELKKGLIWSR